MAEYIEREAAKRRLNFDYAYAAAKLLDELDAADVAPVVHGEWRMVTGDDGSLTAECTECDAVFDNLSMFEFALNYNYCPNCGARMGGE